MSVHVTLGGYSTVTDLARLRGWSTFRPRSPTSPPTRPAGALCGRPPTGWTASTVAPGASSPTLPAPRPGCRSSTRTACSPPPAPALRSGDLSVAARPPERQRHPGDRPGCVTTAGYGDAGAPKPVGSVHLGPGRQTRVSAGDDAPRHRSRSAHQAPRRFLAAWPLSPLPNRQGKSAGCAPRTSHCSAAGCGAAMLRRYFFLTSLMHRCSPLLAVQDFCFPLLSLTTAVTRGLARRASHTPAVVPVACPCGMDGRSWLRIYLTPKSLQRNPPERQQTSPDDSHTSL